MRIMTAVIIGGVSVGLMFQGCQQFGQGKPDYFPVKQAVADANAAVTEYANSEAGQKSQMRLKSAKFTFKVGGNDHGGAHCEYIDPQHRRFYSKRKNKDGCVHVTKGRQ